MKKTPKAQTVMKEDCKAFGVIAAKTVSLQEAFAHPITSVPLAIANPDSTLRQTNKSCLRNLLISQSNADEKAIPKNASWFIDGMAAVRTIPPKAIYKEWLERLIEFVEPPKGSEPTVIGFINDTYRKISIKNGTRKLRGEAGRNTYIDGFEQHMPQGIAWNEFLCNNANKEELTKVISKYLQTDKSRKRFTHPVIVTSGEVTYTIPAGGDIITTTCNHEEADTRLVKHVLDAQNDTVIVSKDTDVLIILIWAYSQYHIKENWYMKYDTHRYASIRKICEVLSPELCQILPAFHAITGCDTTSYFHRKNKATMFSTLMQLSSSHAKLLDNLGIEIDKAIDDVKEFIRTIVYSGKKSEGYVETKVRVFQNLVSKTSQSIPPDPDSAEQCIKRAHLQTYYWLNCAKPIVLPLLFDENGWKFVDNELKPIWFTGYQMPPSLRRGRKGKQSYTADDEGEGTTQNADTRKRKRVQPKKKTERNSRTKQKGKKAITEEVKSIGSALSTMETDASVSNFEEFVGMESVLFTDEREIETIEDVSTPFYEEISEKNESEWELSDFSSSSSDECDEWFVAFFSHLLSISNHYIIYNQFYKCGEGYVLLRSKGSSCK